MAESVKGSGSLLILPTLDKYDPHGFPFLFISLYKI